MIDKPIFDKRLSADPFLILDGGVATELERKGADLNDPLWSAKVLIEKPDLIRETHLEFLLAGADIITTNTYQATVEGFQKKGLSKRQAVDLFSLSVQLAKDAKDEFMSRNPFVGEPLIAGSIGPYGAFLSDGSEYKGIYGIDKIGLKSFHQNRLDMLIGNDIDLLLFETIPNISETETLLELIEERPSCPAIFSFSCKNGKIADGSSFAETVLMVAQHEKVLAVGVNCLHPDSVAPLFESLHGKSSKPLLAYPNNGNTWDAQKKCWICTGHPFKMEELWKEWLHLGVRVIGGCCNTSPSYIQNLHAFREQIIRLKQD